MKGFDGANGVYVWGLRALCVSSAVYPQVLLLLPTAATKQQNVNTRFSVSHAAGKDCVLVSGAEREVKGVMWRPAACSRDSHPCE